ncbi:MAG: nucleotidyltransferase domain-containing protein [Nitrososphaerota archaeon]|nr:nucleotidyltransferase domain-containing protein [Nitrososphaerota archaeon]
MTNTEDVIARAARLVTPTPAETAKVVGVAESTLAKTMKAASRYPETRGALLGGSFAKGTWVPKHVDLDIFVKFDPATPPEVFEKAGLQIGAKATRGFPRGKMYAQHPYTEATVDGIKVNIVPCFDVKKGEWKSAADRSPFHVDLVRRLPEEQKTQVRLLKTFMNAVGVYGAEIQRRGFSGYAAEVLVMKLGGFREVLAWFAEYKLPESRPFTLPDPVDEGRDLGIAVSGESLGRMVFACRGFLSDPALASFQKMTGKTRVALMGDVIAVVFSHVTLSEDTLWGELRRTTKHVVRNLELRGFVIARSMAASDNRGKSAILMIPEFDSLPALEQRIGPTVDRKKDLESFLSSNAKVSRLVWVDDDARARMLVPREHTELAAAISDLVGGRAGSVGASRELEAGMKKSARVLSGKPLKRAAAASRWLQDGIREISTDAFGTS